MSLLWETFLYESVGTHLSKAAAYGKTTFGFKYEQFLNTYYTQTFYIFFVKFKKF
jgi:hypothetical protein